jgi:hypothetical protein
VALPRLERHAVSAPSSWRAPVPLFSRKLRVVTDWTVALFFRRDIAEPGTLGDPRRLDEDG